MSRVDNSTSAESRSARGRRRPLLLLTLLAVLFVLVPFLFWRGTWFGRPLSERKTEQYLSDTQRPRKTQHALVQIAEGILRGDPGVKRWYPQVQALATHELPQIRATVAWVMGQDNRSPEFHAALGDLLADSDPLVRRNAALSLVRFRDARGKPELRSMLQPYVVRASQAGTLTIRLKVSDPINPGTLLGRIQGNEEEAVEIRSPLPGQVQRWLLREGSKLSAGDPVVLLSPSEEQVWEALRAFYLVGEREDLPEIEPFVRGVEGMPERIQEQAILTAEAIRRRAAKTKKVAGEGGPS